MLFIYARTISNERRLPMFKGDALLNSQFLKITPIKSLNECESMLSMSIGGNRLVEDFKKVLQYEDKRKYSGQKEKVLAMHLLVQFPRFSSFEEQQEFVTKFMCSFKNEDGYMPYEHDIPYIFWHSRKAEGEYINILLCQRAIYNQPKVQVAVWKKNTWIDSKTGLFTNKTNPNAILKEKGSFKYDKEGNPIVETIFISPVKDRGFNYCNDSNSDVRNSKFKYFVTGLKLKVQRIINSMCFIKNYIKGIKYNLKTETFTRFDKKEKKGKVLHYNAYLRNIRFALGYCANELSIKKENMLLFNGKYGTKETFSWQYKEFKSLVCKISSIFSNKKLEYIVNSNLKKSTLKSYDFSFRNDEKLSLWKRKFYHVECVINGMIEKFQKNCLDDEYLPFEVLYKEMYRQAKELYEAERTL